MIYSEKKLITKIIEPNFAFLRLNLVEIDNIIEELINYDSFEIYHIAVSKEEAEKVLNEIFPDKFIVCLPSGKYYIMDAKNLEKMLS